VQRRALYSALIAACLMPSAFADVTFQFTGQTNDGKTVSASMTLGAPVTSATIAAPPQAQCAPDCVDVALFPNPQLGYDQLVFELKGPGGIPAAYAFYFPAGAFANPGLYSTIPVSGALTSGSLTVQAAGAPAIQSPLLLPGGVTGAAYSATFSASGGAPPYTYAVDSSTPLPAGLTLSSGGVLSGTPASPFDADILVRVTDSANASSTRSYRLTITSGIAFVTQTLPAGAAGAPYSQAVQVSTPGGQPFQLTVASGSLPPGLSLSGTTINGIPAAGGAYAFRLQAAISGGASTVREFVIQISSGPAIANTSPLPSGSVNTPINIPLTALGGAPPYQWSLVSGSLPNGISLNPFGSLTGTPVVASNVQFVLRVTDSAGNAATQQFVWTVKPGVAISSASPLPAATAGRAYSFTLAATGGTPPYSWSAAGSVPPGLSLSGNTLSGTPTQPGAYSLFITVNDSALGSDVGLFSLQVLPAVAITTASLPNATGGIPYSQTLAATGGAGSYTWSVAAGALPPGLNLSPQGALSGTPTLSGTYNFVVRATDTSGGFALKSFNLAVGASLAITTASQLPQASLGVQYAVTFAASGGNPPYVWTIAGGQVPPGLSLSQSGALSGTPAAAGTYTFDVRVTDQSAAFAQKSFSLTVSAGLVITTPPALPSGVPGVAYSQTLQAAGGTPPYTWTLTSGSLPAGLSLSGAGVLSGTPTAAGNFTFQATVTDSAGATAAQTFTLNIGNNLTFVSPSTLPGAVVGAAYSYTFQAAGGTPPYSWQLAGGAVPPGLSFVLATGTLSGTPTAQGAYMFTIRVTDAAGTSLVSSFSLTVNAALSITTPAALPAASVGAPYSQTLAAAGGVPPYQWSLQSGSLPAGLLLGPDGRISGTPSAPGEFSFTVVVTDSRSATATATFTLSVGAGIAVTTASLANASVGVAYSQTLAAAGGAAPYTWSLSAGSMPPGLTISPGGVISGTPASAGMFMFVVRVTDNAGASAEKAFTINVSPALTITSESPLTNGGFGSFYSFTFAATGGVSPYRWAVVSGLVPEGVTLTPEGLLAGTPRLGGTFSFTVEVTDSAGVKVRKNFSWTVLSPLTITTPSPLPQATAGAAYSLVFGLAGGTAPYTWSVLSGTLPPGLTLAANGTLSGVPAAAGTFQFTVKAADAGQTATQASFTLVVGAGSQPPRTGVISQVASGGSWKTSITLINTNSTPALVRINFFGDDGGSLTLPLTVIEPAGSSTAVAASVERTIAPRATLIVETEALTSTILAGWAEVRATVPVSGFAIFRQKHGSGVDSEGTSPLDGSTPQGFLLPMDNLTGFSTGIALVNLAPDETATVTAVLYDERGQEYARGEIRLPPNGHTAFSAPAQFPSAAGKRGFVEFRTDRPAGLMGLGLRFQPTLSFTSVPIVPAP